MGKETVEHRGWGRRRREEGKGVGKGGGKGAGKWRGRKVEGGRGSSGREVEWFIYFSLAKRK